MWFTDFYRPGGRYRHPYNEQCFLVQAKLVSLPTNYIVVLNRGDTSAPEFAAAAAEMQNGTSLRKAARNHNID